MQHKTQILDTSFGALEVLTGGDGPVLIFLHGEEGQRGWLSHHDILSQSLTVWAPTLPGLGASKKPDWVQTVPHVAKVLLEALDKAGLSSCLLGGASLGGWIAAEMASMQPHRFTGLILVGSQGLPTGHLNTPDIFLTPYRRYIGLGYADSGSDAYSSLWPYNADDDALSHDLEVMELAALLGFKPYMYDRGLLPSLARYKNPALLVWGDADVITPKVIAEEFKLGLSGAAIKTLAAAGHYAHLEQPKNFAKAIVDFGGLLAKKEAT